MYKQSTWFKVSSLSHRVNVKTPDELATLKTSIHADADKKQLYAMMHMPFKIVTADIDENKNQKQYILSTT